MSRATLILFVGCCFSSTLCVAQIEWSGQTAVHFLKGTPSSSPRTVNFGRPSFGWEDDLFVDGHVTDHIAALTTVRVTETQVLNLDYAAIRISDISPAHFNFQAGRFDLPFGNLGERRFPRRNPLFSLPLIYEYGTALPDQATTEQQILASRGTGSGMPLLDGGVYDIGAMVFGSWGILDYALAASSGTISATTYGIQNSNSDVGTVARLAVTPLTGLTLGAAYAQGAYMDEPTTPTPGSVDVNNYRQQAVEFDVEFSRGHAVIYGEGVFNKWPVPLSSGDQEFKIFGYYLEGKYTIMPRLYVALRMSGLNFGNVYLDQQEQRWDYNVAELEGGVGYFLDRDVLLKLVRRDTRTYGGSNPKDGLIVLQLAVSY